MSQRFVPGQKLHKLPGGSLNRAIDMADRIEEFAPPPGPAEGLPPSFAPYLVVAVKNLTGQVLKERAIVGIKETAHDLPEIEPSSSDSADEADAGILAGEAVDVELPDSTKHTAGRWGVTLGPIDVPDESGNGGSGYMVIGGLVKCRILQKNRTDGCAVIVTGETDFLESAASGTPVTWRTHREEDEENSDSSEPYVETLQWGQINLGSGGGGGATTTDIKFGRCDGGLVAAAGWAKEDGGYGRVQFVGDDGQVVNANGDDEDISYGVLNRYFEYIIAGAPLYVRPLDPPMTFFEGEANEIVLNFETVNAGCHPGPALEGT